MAVIITFSIIEIIRDQESRVGPVYYGVRSILGKGMPMKRVHLFEFMDQPWYPAVFRRMQADYLQFVVTRGSGHEQLIPLIKKALSQAKTTDIVDLCSGGTGPWLKLQAQLAEAGSPVSVKLTDKYPDPTSINKWPIAADIEYLAEPVDALCVPRHLTGMRTLFEGFHHFRPDQARAILRDAAEQKAAIGIFEATFSGPLGTLLLVLSPLLTLLGYIFVTPFIRPRSFARFLWTYLIPAVPLATAWDGLISMLRVYSPQELKTLTDSLGVDDYLWEIGQASSGTPLFAYIYVIGYPR